jgi:hypothetical protein
VPTAKCSYDAELQRHNEVLRRAAGVRPGDHVLDVGCGTGQTTCQAARTARAGGVAGIDVSARAIERAREIARQEGVRNVTFCCGDVTICRSLTSAQRSPALPAWGPDRFSLADPPAVCESCRPRGPPTSASSTSTSPSATARTWPPHSTGSVASCTAGLLKRLEPGARAAAVERLREALAAQLRRDGVWFDSRAWVVTARRR